jgi:predicted nucleic acid-binding protein
LIVVDSSVWIATLRGQRTAQVTRLLEVSIQEPLIVGDLVMVEVLQGARDDLHAARIEQNLRQHVVEAMVTDEIAVRAARNYRIMRRQGVTVRKTIDVLIGTFCIERGHKLLHDDRDFDPMEAILGLQVVR